MTTPALERHVPRALVYIDHHPDLDEYRVCPSGGAEAVAYYTGDKQDAIDTAHAQYGESIVIMHRCKRYGEG